MRSLSEETGPCATLFPSFSRLPVFRWFVRLAFPWPVATGWRCKCSPGRRCCATIQGARQSQKPSKRPSAGPLHVQCARRSPRGSKGKRRRPPSSSWIRRQRGSHYRFRLCLDGRRARIFPIGLWENLPWPSVSRRRRSLFPSSADRQKAAQGAAVPESQMHSRVI